MTDRAVGLIATSSTTYNEPYDLARCRGAACFGTSTPVEHYGLVKPASQFALRSPPQLSAAAPN